jgi:hypothetical protein
MKQLVNMLLQLHRIKRNKRFAPYFVFSLLFGAAAFYSGYEMGKVEVERESVEENVDRSVLTFR